MGFKKDQTAKQVKESYYVDNRFGKVLLDTNYKVFFPYGLVGIGDFKEFCISVPPADKYNGFKLLQSIDNQHLCFLILPIINDGTYLVQDEVFKVLDYFNIDKQQTALALIISNKIIDGKNRVVANVRAPIIFDLEQKYCYQYIFRGNADKNIKIIA